jgi:hypothetical protein
MRLFVNGHYLPNLIERFHLLANGRFIEPDSLAARDRPRSCAAFASPLAISFSSPDLRTSSGIRIQSIRRWLPMSCVKPHAPLASE